MDSSTITAMSAMFGSLIGTLASIVTNWMTLRSQFVRERAAEELGRRRLLYEEFIRDASDSVIDSLSHSLDQPEKFVKLYSNVSSIRLVSSPQVLAAAEPCCRQIVELYAKPNLSIDEIRRSFEVDQFDPLREFSIACRAELRQFAPAIAGQPRAV